MNEDFKQLIEDAELDNKLEQEMRSEVCEERGHKVVLLAACKVCGTAFHIPGQSDRVVGDYDC